MDYFKENQVFARGKNYYENIDFNGLPLPFIT